MEIDAAGYLALSGWILLMGLASAMSVGNARKNAGRPLAAVWWTMSVLCAWWLASAVIGLMGGPFVLLYRIGIGFAAVAVVILFVTGRFQDPRF